MISPLDTVYEKYKHLDGCLSDPEWCTSGEGAAIYVIAGELWRAVKEARDMQTNDTIPALINENARIGAELKRANELISRLNGEHDARIAAQATEAERARLTQGRKVITLCGSVKFWDEYIRQNAILTLQGNIVLSCGLSLKEGYEDILVDLPIDDVKRDLDFLHLRKIDLSDEIFVLNVGGYIGNSTQREIEYALSTGKKVRYLESLRLAQPEPTEREPE